MTKEIVKTKDAPEAIGPYSQGIVVSSTKLVFTAGQIPMDAETGRIVSGNIEVQTKQVFKKH
jgi:2-iminobutanoate/2-iminopropanoate deaminase